MKVKVFNKEFEVNVEKVFNEAKPEDYCDLGDIFGVNIKSCIDYPFLDISIQNAYLCYNILESSIEVDVYYSDMSDDESVEIVNGDDLEIATTEIDLITNKLYS